VKPLQYALHTVLPFAKIAKKKNPHGIATDDDEDDDDVSYYLSKIICFLLFWMKYSTTQTSYASEYKRSYI